MESTYEAVLREDAHWYAGERERIYYVPGFWENGDRQKKVTDSSYVGKVTAVALHSTTLQTGKAAFISRFCAILVQT
jgi:hypothetical protein